MIKLLSDKCMNYEAEDGFYVRANGTQTCSYRKRKSIEPRLCQKAGSSVLFFTDYSVIFSLVDNRFTIADFDYVAFRVGT